MPALGSTPVIENCDPNLRFGSEAEIQTGTLPALPRLAVAAKAMNAPKTLAAALCSATMVRCDFVTRADIVWTWAAMSRKLF